MPWRWPAVLLLLLLIGGISPAPVIRVVAQERASAPDLSAVTLTANDCSFLIQFDDDPRPRLGDIACGTLDVPENWSDPDGRRLQIGYVVLKSTSADPAPDPVVYLEGGPGASALTGAEFRAQIFDGMRQTRDIVMFDQRGTRLSSPLRCQELSASQVPAVDDTGEDELAATPPAPPLPRLPSELGDPYDIMQSARQDLAAAAASCVREITASGVDLRQYNSIASANDTVALIEALGYDQFNLYGISYGTRLALVIMRDHPESGIRGVVLDSTFPPEVKGFERYPEEPHEVVIQLFADCALDRACSTAYPNLKARFVALLETLRASPVPSAEGIPITDRDLIEVMQALSQNVAAVPYVPRMIEELERGEDDTFLGIVTGSLFAAEDDPAADVEADIQDATPPADLSGFPPARRFLVELEARFSTLPEDEASHLFNLLLHLDKVSQDRGSLAEFVARAFPEPEQAATRADLLGILATMSDEEVQQVFAVLAETVTLIDVLTFGSSQPQFNSVECNEEIPFQAFENTVATARQLEIPEMAMGVVDQIASQFATCEVWPSGRAAAIEEMPVRSDVPTLILAGSYDLQTPVSWNKSAFVTLPNGLFLEFPMAGHGVITYSACAEGIAAAFIADPRAMPDTSCMAGLDPAWVLPDEPETTAIATPAA
jgi:pimeloyl-ACP methyl ester carboxylesterase